MSDLNDDLLNYELGDLDDTVLAADEDELLQSDDESSPTKLSQQEEALLLDEDILICPPETQRSEQPNLDDRSATTELGNVVEIRDDSVTTTTPEPTTSQNHASTDTANQIESDLNGALNGTPSKLPPTETDEAFQTTTLPESKPLRAEAADFVPTHIEHPTAIVVEEPSNDEISAETMSFVSTSTDFVDLLHDDGMVLSQRTSAEEQTESSVSLSIMNEDELDVPGTTDDEVQEPNCSIQTGNEIKDAASSTGPEESDSKLGRPTAGVSSLLPEMETEDEDDGNERLNPKHRVERERDDQDETFNKATSSSSTKNFHRNQRGVGGNGNHRGPGGPGFSGRQPLQRFPPHQSFNHYQPSHNENFNPQFPNQFRSANDRGPSLLMNPHTLPIGSNPPLLQFRGHLPQQHPNFRPVFNPDGSRPRMGGPALLSRHPRPDFPTMNHNQPLFRSFNGAHGMRPGPIVHNMAPRFEMHHRPRMMNAQQQPQPQHQPQQQMPAQFLTPRGAPHQPNMAYGGGGPTHANHAGSASMSHSGVATASIASGGGPPSGVVPPLIPRKVLINPNFKGGVEAATNQLMMDTMKNPQYMPPVPAASGAISNHDAELLRQQEAFINQNRRHIEKRRHERSPERDYRDRSYSPPRRERRAYSRERDAIRKPTGGASGGPHRGGELAASRGGHGRDRRGNSREPKRRRSNSVDRDGRPMPHKDVKEPEDEETKTYRLMIEKQKSQREKLLKDKEMRRRQAAEGVKGPEDTKLEEMQMHAGQAVPSSQPSVAQKLTPIVVTEKKIISLKKKEQHPPTAGAIHPPDRVVSTGNTTTKVVRNLPTAKVFPESKRQTGTTAVVKPVAKTKPIQQSEFEDEDELLADSPSSSPTPGQSATQQKVSTAVSQTSRFANRRVVLKTSHGAVSKKSVNAATNQDRKPTESAQTATVGAKRIFDRLDRKVMNVTDAAKRKIPRIVIQNND